MNTFPNPIPVMTICLCILGGLSCTTTASNEEKRNQPVTWDTGFIMMDLLASTVEINQISDLTQLVSTPWYSEIQVIQSNNGETKFSSCEDYENNATPLTRSKKANEMNSYLEFKIMCEATQLLLTAKSSSRTYLPKFILNENLPMQWPKNMALQVSVKESNRSAHNSALKTWADISPIIKYESKSLAKSIYYHSGGYQEVDIVGRGDINGDSIEDVIVVLRDHVTGGDYFNIRLFALSYDKQDNWSLIDVF